MLRITWLFSAIVLCLSPDSWASPEQDLGILKQNCLNGRAASFQVLKRVYTLDCDFFLEKSVLDLESHPAKKDRVHLETDEFKQLVRRYPVKKWLRIDYDSIEKDGTFFQWVLSHQANFPDISPGPMSFYKFTRNLFFSEPQRFYQHVGLVAKVKVLYYVPGRFSYEDHIREFSGKVLSFSNGNLHLLNENTGEKLFLGDQDQVFDLQMEKPHGWISSESEKSIRYLKTGRKAYGTVFTQSAFPISGEIELIRESLGIYLFSVTDPWGGTFRIDSRTPWFEVWLSDLEEDRLSFLQLTPSQHFPRRYFFRWPQLEEENIGKLLLEISKKNLNPYESPFFYTVLEENPQFTADLIKRWYFKKATVRSADEAQNEIESFQRVKKLAQGNELVTKVFAQMRLEYTQAGQKKAEEAERLIQTEVDALKASFGRFFPLLVDPGIMSRKAHFLSFLSCNLDSLKSLSLFQVREVYAQTLKPNRIQLYRAMVLSQEDYQYIIKNGIIAPGVRTALNNENLDEMFEKTWRTEFFDGESIPLYPTSPLGEILSRLNRDGDDFSSGSRNRRYFGYMSLTAYPDVAKSAAYHYTNSLDSKTGKLKDGLNLYLFKVEVPALSVIFMDQEELFRFKKVDSDVDFNGKFYRYSDPYLEVFTPYWIQKTWITGSDLVTEIPGKPRVF